MLHHLITVYLFLLTICLSAAEPVDPNQIRKHAAKINHSVIQDFENHYLKLSIETKIRQIILMSHIQPLNLRRLEYVKCRQIEKNINDEQLKYINAQKTNFTKDSKEIDGYLANSLILINLRADDGMENPKIISYFAPLETFLSCEIFLNYLTKLAILSTFDPYSHFTFSFIREGQYIRGVFGLTEKQDGEKFREKMKEEVGEDSLSLYIPRKGGAPQLFITYAEHSEHYDLGPISNRTNYDFFIDKKGKINPNVKEKDYRPLLYIKLKEAFAPFVSACQRAINSDAYQYPYRYLHDYHNNILNLYIKMNNQICIRHSSYKPCQLHKPSSLTLYKPQLKDIALYKPNLLHQRHYQILKIIKYVAK